MVARNGVSIWEKFPIWEKVSNWERFSNWEKFPNWENLVSIWDARLRANFEKNQILEIFMVFVPLQNT